MENSGEVVLVAVKSNPFPRRFFARVFRADYFTRELSSSEKRNNRLAGRSNGGGKLASKKLERRFDCGEEFIGQTGVASRYKSFAGIFAMSDKLRRTENNLEDRNRNTI